MLLRSVDQSLQRLRNWKRVLHETDRPLRLATVTSSGHLRTPRFLLAARGHAPRYRNKPPSLIDGLRPVGDHTGT